MKVGGLEIELLANIARLQADMDRAQKVVESAMGKIERVVGRALGVLSGLGIGLSVAGLVALTGAAINSVDALNDVRDATGASIENISALQDVARRTGTSVDTVAAALVKFNKEVGEAKPGRGVDVVLKSIGLNAEALKRIDPAEALRLTAVALSQFADDGNKARAIQALFGKSVREVAPLLKDLAEQGKLNGTITREQAEEAERLNKELFAMQANVGQAAVAITRDLVPALNNLFKTYREGGLGGVAALIFREDEFSKASAQADLLRADITRTGDTIARMSQQLNRDPSNDFLAARIEKARARMAELVRQSDVTKAALLSAAGAAPRDEYSNEGRSRGAPSVADIAAAEAAAERAAKAREAAAKLSEQQRKEREAAQLRGAQEIAEARVAARRAEQAVIDDHTRAQTEAYAQQARAAEDALAAAELEYEQYDKTKSQIAQITLLTLKSTRAKINDGTEGAASLDRQIDAQERLIELLRRGEVREAAADAAKAAAAEWEKTSESISTSLTDALLRGFESGKGFARNLIDTTKNLFATLVLRPQIQAVLGISGAGASGAAFAGGAGGAGGGGLGGLGSITSLFGGNSIGVGIGGGLVDVGNALVGLGFDNFGAGLSGLANGAAGYGNIAYGAAGLLGGLGGSLFGGQGATGGSLGATAGLAIGGPLGAALGGLAGGLIGSLFGGGTPYHKGGLYQARADGSGYRPTTRAQLESLIPGLGSASYDDYTKRKSGPLDAATKNLAEGLQGSLVAILGTFGQEADDVFVNFRANGKRGRGGVKIGDTFTAFKTDENNVEKGFAQFTDAAARSLLTSLNKADIPAWAQTLLAEVGKAPGLEALQTVARTIEQVQQLTTVLRALPFANLKNISEASAIALGKAAGGIDKLNASITSYYAEYYTAEERAAETRAQLTKTLATLGVSLPASREQFRALVTAQDLSTDAGRKMYAQLLELAPAFASVTDATVEAANQTQQAFRDAVRGVTDTLMAEAQRIRGLMGGGGMQSFAAAQAEFTVTSASARSGNQEAAKLLPALSQALLDLAAQNAASAQDLARIRAQTAASLDSTAGALGTALGVPVQTPANAVPAAPYAAMTTGRSTTEDTLAALQALQDEMAAMRRAAERTEQHTRKTSDTLTRVTQDGDALVTTPL